MLRRRWNVQGLLLSVLFPWAIFAAVFAVASFPLPETAVAGSSQLCFLACALALFAALAPGVPAVLAWSRRAQHSGLQEPTWCSFLLVTGLLAWLLGVLLGCYNYRTNLARYYFITSLRFYDAVDPAVARGGQLMDAGRVTFAPGSRVDATRSLGFRQGHLYCVAPIVPSGDQKLANYDFWAVGVDCCTDHTADFHCGEYANRIARSGVRLASDEQRPWFLLALQQAEAAYGIRAEQPVFLHWVQDPSAGVEGGHTESLRFYLTGISLQLVVQALLVLGASACLLGVLGA